MSTDDTTESILNFFHVKFFKIRVFLILSKVGVSGLLGVFHRLALPDETSLTDETSKGEIGGVGEGFGVVLRADKGGDF